MISWLELLSYKKVQAVECFLSVSQELQWLKITSVEWGWVKDLEIVLQVCTSFLPDFPSLTCWSSCLMWFNKCCVQRILPLLGMLSHNMNYFCLCWKSLEVRGKNSGQLPMWRSSGWQSTTNAWMIHGPMQLQCVSYLKFTLMQTKIAQLSTLQHVSPGSKSIGNLPILQKQQRCSTCWYVVTSSYWL